MRGSRPTVLSVCFALLALTTTVSAGQPNPPPAYEIIVHPGNPLKVVNRKFLEDAFLKKITRWPDDSVIHPVDSIPNRSARASFSRDVLERSVAAVKAYWQQRIFSGRDVPPPELDSDERIVNYVLEHEGAVGYVSPTANVRGAKPLTVSK